MRCRGIRGEPLVASRPLRYDCCFGPRQAARGRRRRRLSEIGPRIPEDPIITYLTSGNFWSSYANPFAPKARRGRAAQRSYEGRKARGPKAAACKAPRRGRLQASRSRWLPPSAHRVSEGFGRVRALAR